MNPANRLISADFPGVVARILGDRYKLVLFINGSAGDMSTRFTRRESSFAECERMGGIAAKAITTLLETESPFEELEGIDQVFHRVYLAEAGIRDPEDAAKGLADAEKNLETVRARGNARETRKAESFVEGARYALAKARRAGDRANETAEAARAAGLAGTAGGGEFPVELSILRVRGQEKTARILCSPMEIFSTLALGFKEKTGAEMFGYTNNYQGYLADREAYKNNDYEALLSRFAPGQGERYIEEAVSLFYNGVVRKLQFSNKFR
jgi:hypothetical protein